MDELRIEPGPGIPGGLVIPAGELVERFTHSSGPGGQGVNTASSRVQLTFDVAASAALSEQQRERVLRRLRGRLSGASLIIDASETRSQRRNRVAARERLVALLREGLAPPPPVRRSTRPTRGSVERRLKAKRIRAEVKEGRRRPRER
ncbi:MAG TPA: aminoacyl-tRNA hydrolase [Actinomycetales bacterium]|nr:aminoacyl-tRNA hydrolase [Actinomycetales bacterium]